MTPEEAIKKYKEQHFSGKCREKFTMVLGDNCPYCIQEFFEEFELEKHKQAHQRDVCYKNPVDAIFNCPYCNIEPFWIEHFQKRESKKSS